jgi:hypothetical protein
MLGAMRGKGKPFDAAVFFALGFAAFALSAWAGVPVLGLIVGLVFFGLALRSAWSRRD